MVFVSLTYKYLRYFEFNETIVLLQSLKVIIWNSVVGIATRYGLEGPGIESRWWRDFPYTFRPALGSTQPPVQRVPGFFPGGKAAGAWRLSPTPI